MTLFEQFKASSPVWAMLMSKIEYGQLQHSEAFTDGNKQYWQGYMDSCGELTENIEEFFNGFNESNYEPQAYTRQFILDISKDES